MFYIFEMANNHQGSVAHAKRIIKEFSRVAKETNVNAAIKLQFRQLDTFIHDDYKQSDLKFVKRFRSTRLSKEQFREIVECIRNSGLTPIATPFDNESLEWFSDFNIPVVKIASCSIDDWPLLRQVCKINKKIIISTAGADLKTLKKVYKMFKQESRDFAFMHCVGEYPTPVKNSNLNRIKILKANFPDIEIGFSTHESPEQISLCPHAAALGCSIIEKHVGVRTDTIDLNLYSNTPEQMRKVIEEVKVIEAAMVGTSPEERGSLSKLKRGVYLKTNLPKGTVLSEEHFYYSMPKQERQYDASDYYYLLGKTITNSLTKGDPLNKEDVRHEKSKIIKEIIDKTNDTLSSAMVPIFGNEKVEISCHYGIENFFQYGALIIDKVNREYCKKLIIMFPNQQHPTHRHIKKEEAFELLSGDCKLVLNGKEINLKKGKPVLIPREVKHSFSTNNGCIVEEISTTHYVGDSIYDDFVINSLKTSERKVKISLKEDTE